MKKKQVDEMMLFNTGLIVKFIVITLKIFDLNWSLENWKVSMYIETKQYDFLKTF